MGKEHEWWLGECLITIAGEATSDSLPFFVMRSNFVQVRRSVKYVVFSYTGSRLALHFSRAYSALTECRCPYLPR